MEGDVQTKEKLKIHKGISAIQLLYQTNPHEKTNNEKIKQHKTNIEFGDYILYPLKSQCNRREH